MIKEKLSRYMFPLRVALGLIFLLVLIHHVDFASFLRLSSFQVISILMVIVVLVLTACLEAGRLRSLTQNRYDLKTMVQTIFISAFITNFTPSNIGGDGYKVYKIGKQRGYTGGAALIFLERGIGLGVLIAVSMIFALSLGGAWVDDYYAIGPAADIRSYWNEFTRWLVLAVVVAIMIFVSVFRRAFRKITWEFVQAFIQLPASALLKVLLITLLFHVIRASSLCGVLAIIDSSLDFPQAWVVLTFTAVASLVPLSIGALGIREAAFVVALAPFAIAAPEALFAGFVYRAASILQAAIGGFLTTREYSSPAEKTIGLE